MTAPSSRSGILLVDKPSGKTSAQVLNEIKKKLAIEKIGHGGTLDPFATGLLVVLLGEATKIARFLLEGEKTYLAEANLEFRTITGDLTGESVERSESASKLEQQDWQELAKSFLGRSKQTPPAFSAVKVKGKALYEYARKGETVEVKEREIQISKFEILSAEEKQVRFLVTSSGGTYIRVLAEDLAAKAHLKAHLTALRRTQSSQFSVERALGLAEILQHTQESLPLIGISDGLSHLPRVQCDSAQAQKVRNGNLSVFDSLRPQLTFPGYFALEEAGKLVAICNHHPMMIPFCSIERVFDPKSIDP
jgi:tRNA pseudouridine55 synthase